MRSCSSWGIVCITLAVRDEYDFGEIAIRDVEIMIGEGVVQFGIERLPSMPPEGIAAEVCGAMLVHFVQDALEIGFHRPGLLHHLNDLAGQGISVGAPVTANFRFIAYAAEKASRTNFPVRVAVRPMDMAREVLHPRCRGPTKQRIEPRGFFTRLPHGEKFRDALFYFFEAVMIFFRIFSARAMSRISSILLHGTVIQPFQR